jgi:hypothetical protein
MTGIAEQNQDEELLQLVRALDPVQEQSSQSLTKMPDREVTRGGTINTSELAATCDWL